MSVKAGALHLRTKGIGPWGTNAYVLVCPTTQESVLIDPAGEPDTLLGMLEGSEPIAILLTHSHMDHIGALREMQASLEVPVMAHPGGTVREVDTWLADGDLIQVGEHYLRVYHTPGHGVSFRLGDRRAAIEAFLARDHGAFFGDATWEM